MIYDLYIYINTHVGIWLCLRIKLLLYDKLTYSNSIADLSYYI